MTTEHLSKTFTTAGFLKAQRRESQDKTWEVGMVVVTHLRGDPSFTLAKATRRRHAWRKEGGRKGGGRAEGRGLGEDVRAQQQLCAHLLGQGRAWGTYRAVPGGEAAGIGPFSTVVTKQK